jgi:hypothetical protein
MMTDTYMRAGSRHVLTHMWHKKKMLSQTQDEAAAKKAAEEAAAAKKKVFVCVCVCSLFPLSPPPRATPPCEFVVCL